MEKFFHGKTCRYAACQTAITYCSLRLLVCDGQHDAKSGVAFDIVRSLSPSVVRLYGIWIDWQIDELCYGRPVLHFKQRGNLKQFKIRTTF